MHRICMVGTGYVGLVSGVCLADFGNQVTCVDADATKIRSLESGVIPFYELGLEELVEKNVREGRLTFMLNSGRRATLARTASRTRASSA